MSDERVEGKHSGAEDKNEHGCEEERVRIGTVEFSRIAEEREERGQPPDYIQYDSPSGGPGPVRYELSALMKFREDHKRKKS
jgi:hypothetical protein